MRKVVGSLLYSEWGICQVYRRGERTESERERENVGYGVGRRGRSISAIWNRDKKDIPT